MLDPATGSILGTAAGSLTLINAIVRVCQEHDKNPDASPPNVAELVAMLPAAALKTTGDLIDQIKQLRQECHEVGIDLSLTVDKLQEDTWFYERSRRRLLKAFQVRVEGIGAQVSILFDDLVSISDCADYLQSITRSFEASRKQKEILRKETREDVPVGEILDKLEEHAEQARAQLGDLNRSR